MGDWKKELNKYSVSTGGAAVAKNCEKCGKPLKDPKYRLCFNCSQAARESGSGGAGGGSNALSPDYLQGGYFDAKGYLRERYIARGGDADGIAKQLGFDRPPMVTHQLRRFYGHVRAAENRLKMTGDFPAVYIDLKKLDSFVAEAKGKGKIPDLFYDFITKNLDAIKTEKDFMDGFLEHFQAVVGFFTFHHPKK
jgi:CRISPR-associated protein Csm2